MKQVKTNIILDETYRASINSLIENLALEKEKDLINIDFNTRQKLYHIIEQGKIKKLQFRSEFAQLNQNYLKQILSLVSN
jgi:hypothetical protein